MINKAEIQRAKIPHYYGLSLLDIGSFKKTNMSQGETVAGL